MDSVDYLIKQKRRLQLMKKLHELTNNFTLLTYVPHSKQDRFHRAGGKRRRGVFAGNRFGKSKMGCQEDCAWIYGERLWYPKDDPARFCGIPKRPVKGLVITTDWDKVDEIWTSERGANPGKLWQALPSDFVKSKRRNHSGAIETVECANGSLLRFDTVKSWKSNPQGSESSDWDFIHVDEPCPQSMWKAASRGLVDRDGFAWFTLTALTEPWITDMFSPRDTRLRNVEHLETEDFWMIRGAMRDNVHLSEDAIKMFEAELSDEEKMCRLEGIPMALAGLIYREFDFPTHVLDSTPKGWDSWTSPPKEWPIYLAIDPHPQTPHAVLFITVSPFGQIFIYDELFVHCQIKDLCELIHQKVDDRNVVLVLCDPLGYINDPITGTNMEEEFARYGVFVEKATKALTQGIFRVKDELKKPNRLIFSPFVTETLWEIQRYSWDTSNPDRKNKPVDKDDHMMENLYRLLLSDPVWVDYKKMSNRPVDDMEISGPGFEEDETLSLEL